MSRLMGFMLIYLSLRLKSLPKVRYWETSKVSWGSKDFTKSASRHVTSILQLGDFVLLHRVMRQNHLISLGSC